MLNKRDASRNCTHCGTTGQFQVLNVYWRAINATYMDRLVLEFCEKLHSCERRPETDPSEARHLA